MQLHTRAVGTGSRTAALVHGASMSGDAWRDLTPYLLEHDLTLILVDQRGHGDSPRADSYRVEEFAQDLVDTLPTGLDYLFGQSLGGLTGAWAAERLQPKGAPADHTQRVRAMWNKWDESCLEDIKSSYDARPFPIGPPPVPSTLVLADPSFAVRPDAADALRANGWDVRVMAGGVHDLHIQDPARLAAVLEDVLAAPAA